MANFLWRAARCHAFLQVDRGDRLTDEGNGLQIFRVALQRRLVHLRFKVAGETEAELGFDHHSRCAIRHAEKALEYLIRGDRVAVACQGFRVRAARNHFAVD